MHWPAPIVASEIEHDRGPVLVTIEYRIDPKDREPFLAALKKLARERRRDGAYAWGVFEDSADLSRMVETFLVETWLEHLRQHERVSNADRVLGYSSPIPDRGCTQNHAPDCRRAWPRSRGSEIDLKSHASTARSHSLTVSARHDEDFCP